MQTQGFAEYSSSIPIVPSDTAQVVNCRAILVTGAGNLVYKQGPIGALGAAVTVPVVAGQILPIELNQGVVMATGTTATGLLALS